MRARISWKCFWNPAKRAMSVDAMVSYDLVEAPVLRLRTSGSRGVDQSRSLVEWYLRGVDRGEAGKEDFIESG
jgi:hypothetical protein